MGDRGAGNRGDVRPRVDCPGCGRSTAVTFDSRTGAAYVRSHNHKDSGRLCPMSRQIVDRRRLRG